MTLEDKIKRIKESLSARSKTSIINDICESVDSDNVEDIAWMFDIYLGE